MPDKVFVRNIPDELWRALKSKASLEGKTVSNAVREAISVYLASPDTAAGSGWNDPWSGIVGLADSGPDDVSERHDDYLAGALDPAGE